MENPSTTAIQLIVSDIDGTLLNLQRDVAPETAAEIQRVWNTHQIPTVLASGRMSRAMQHIKRCIGLTQFPMISYNGALIQDALLEDGSSEVLFSKTFTATIAEAIYTEGKQNGVQIGLYAYDDWHVEQIDRWSQHEIDHTKIAPAVTDNAQVLAQWKTQNRGLHKLMLIGETDKIDRLEPQLRSQYGADLHIYRSNAFIIEVCPMGVTKRTAVEFVQQKMNVARENIMAIGDNMNDLAMLEYVGLGIAVENAKPAVKEIANDITATNLEFGVAKALQKYFGSGE